jgi:hypothetical protein
MDKTYGGEEAASRLPVPWYDTFKIMEWLDTNAYIPG